MFNALNKLKEAVDGHIITPDEAETLVKALLFVQASGPDASALNERMKFYMFKWPDPTVEELLKAT